MGSVDVRVAEDDDPSVACLVEVEVGPEPAPMAAKSAWASALSMTCFMVDFEALTTLPRSGSTAIVSALRPALAGPAAESPSTINSSESIPWLAASRPACRGARRR